MNTDNADNLTVTDPTVPVSDPAPAPIVAVISAVRRFTDDMERMAGAIAPAAYQLTPVQLAWVIDRLDDVRATLEDAYGELAGPATAQGIDAASWSELTADLTDVGGSAYQAMTTLDPDGERYDIVALTVSDSPHQGNIPITSGPRDGQPVAVIAPPTREETAAAVSRLPEGRTRRRSCRHQLRHHPRRRHRLARPGEAVGEVR